MTTESPPVAPEESGTRELLTAALEYLLTGVITHADKDYMVRAINRAEVALKQAMPGWSPPVPTTAPLPPLNNDWVLELYNVVGQGQGWFFTGRARTTNDAGTREPKLAMRYPSRADAARAADGIVSLAGSGYWEPVLFKDVA